MLSIKLQKEIIETIVKHKHPEKIVVFGSRATDSYKKTSDIDIAVFGRDWTDKDINIVKFNLDENIKTPLKFDVVNFYALTKKELKEDILKNGEVIYDAEKN